VFVTPNESGPGVNIEFLSDAVVVPAEVRLPQVDQRIPANLHLNGYEVMQVLVDVLLYGVAPIEVGSDLAIYLAPRASYLGTQISSERAQVLIQRAITISHTDSQKLWTIEVIATAHSPCIAVLVFPRSFDDDLGHVFAHKGNP
jgi:hypothetical protein